MLVAAAAALILVGATTDEVCSMVGTVAEGLMTHRQRGVVMSEMMQAVEPGDAFTTDLFRQLIVGAYKVPAFATDEMQQRAVRDFRNEAELACYENAKQQAR